MVKKLKRLEKDKHIHLIGIGGIGMSGIAGLLLEKGFCISGSDIKTGEMINRLKSKGVDIFIGHNKDNIKKADIVVYSSAVKDDNPEILEAKNRNLILLKRAECLARLMQDTTTITITGMHGKTTTTSLISHLLITSGLNPTVAVGGILSGLNNNAQLGDGNFFVAEADESDGSFLCYKPDYSIITNLDYEHLDFFGNFERILRVFKLFLNKTKKGGCIFVCADSIPMMELIKGYKRKYISFGTINEPDIYPKRIVVKDFYTYFDCFYNAIRLGNIRLALSGRHNICNALSVIALGLEIGLDFKKIKEALANFKGVERRFQVKVRNKKFILIDDYAHHPTEIKAVLQAGFNIKHKRMIVVFQPHRFSRTKYLWDDFISSFKGADLVILTDIYPAAEEAIPGIDSRILCKAMKEKNYKNVIYLEKYKIVNYLKDRVSKSDLIFTLGAGDISKISNELAEELKG